MNPNNTTARHFPLGSLMLASALTVTPAAHGAVIATEDFAYSDGALAGNNGGTGTWNGAWANNTGVGPFGTVSGGKYFTGANTMNSARPITVTASTNPIYFSATFTKTSATAGYAFWLQLGVSDAVAGNDTVRIGLANDKFSARIRQGTVELGDQIGEGGDTGTYTVGATVTIVGKLEYDVSGTNERLSIWVNPTGVETAAITSSVLGDVGWTTPTHAHIRNVLLDANAASMDNLKIGDSWSSVAIPEPSAALLGGLGLLALLRRRR